jgi:LPXTG-motif cell wall-anchored protein
VGRTRGRGAGRALRHGTRTRFAAVAAAAFAIALFAASCDSGSSDSSSKGSGSSTTAASAKATDAAAKPVGPEAAVAQYVASQGASYAGDCSTAKLPQDKGKWCFTLVSGAESNSQRVYGVGPVGSPPKKFITVDRRGQAQLTPGDQVGVSNGDVGPVQALPYDELAANPFIIGNLTLDQQAGIGNGASDIQSGVPPTTTAPPAGGGGTPAAGGPVVQQGGGGIVAANEYPATSNVVIENPTVESARAVRFDGTGCDAGEELGVQLDGSTVGVVTASATGTFSGSLPIPPGAAPGAHTLTVRGRVCVLSATVTVLPASALAFTGSSSHTSTYVLGGIAAIVVGCALVVGARRRRHIGASGSGPSPA